MPSAGWVPTARAVLVYTFSTCDVTRFSTLTATGFEPCCYRRRAEVFVPRWLHVIALTLLVQTLS